MNGVKELILHIGYPKTGTTSIQKFCFLNRPKLMEHGYLYPNSCGQSWGHHILTKYYYRPEAKWIIGVDKEKAYGDLILEIETKNPNKVIISSEVYIQAKLISDLREDLEHYFKDWKIKIIAYLRRQDRWLGSQYNQITKTGNNQLSPKLFLEKRFEEHNYFKVLEIWAHNFSHENILIVPFEKDQWKNRSIEQEFLRLIDIEDTSLFNYPEVANTRLNRDCLEFLSLTYPDSIRIGKQFRYLMSLLEEYSFQNPNSREYNEVFSPEQRIMVYNHYKKSNSEIAKKYLNREDGILFYEPPPSKDELWKPYPGIKNESLIKIQKHLLDKLIFKKKPK